MRDRLDDRGRSRAYGPLDARLSSVYANRVPYYVPDIPLQIGTPVIWVDPAITPMVAGIEQGGFTDRASVTWAVTTVSGLTGMWQVPGVLNGRNAYRSSGPQDSDLAGSGEISMMNTTGTVTIGPSFTVFIVVRLMSTRTSNQDGTVALMLRQQVSVADATNNWYVYMDQNQAFLGARVDAGTVGTATSVAKCGKTSVVTFQSQQTRNEIWHNGTVGSNANPGTTVTNPRNLYWGGLPTSPNTYNAHMEYGDIIIYNSILSSTDRNVVEKYLGRKYGVTIA